MKKFLNLFACMLMFAVAFSSCKKDDPSYPGSISDSVWSGANASTGYTCDISFTTSGSVGNYCLITVATPGKDAEQTGVFGGQFTYDPNNGIATVTFEAQDGAPSKATLQFHDGGTALDVSFTAANVNFGTYTLTPVTYPKSIAGTWSSSLPGVTVKVILYPYALEAGLPCDIKVTVGTTNMDLTGIYTYDPITGKGTFNTNTSVYAGTLQYNPTDKTITCNMGDTIKDLKLARTK